MHENAMLAHINYCITYQPISKEIDPSSIPMLKEHSFTDTFVLPASAEISPCAIAENLKKIYPSQGVCILIPGTAFDKTGTRHGRGKGWFDRFLAAVPYLWIRIGIIDSERLSSTPLVRKSWDQPVDWIICKKQNEWKIVETRARKLPTPVLLS